MDVVSTASLNTDNLQQNDFLKYCLLSKFESEKVFLSTEISLFTDENRKEKRAIVLSASKIYIFKSAIEHANIPYEMIDEISISKLSNEFVIHCRSFYDFRILSNHKNLIICTILFVLGERKISNGILNVYELNRINLSDRTTKLMFKSGLKKRPFGKRTSVSCTKMNIHQFRHAISIDEAKKDVIREKTISISASDINTSIHDFEVHKMLKNCHGHGFVLRAWHVFDKKEYIIRGIKSNVIKKEEIELYIGIMKNCKSNSFILPLKFAFQIENQHFYFVFAFMKRGNLIQHIISQKKKRLTEMDSKKYAFQILIAISMLHSRNMFHGNLKLTNVLISDDGGVCVDFSEIIRKGEQKYNSRQSIEHENINIKNWMQFDWLSFGVIIFQMIFGDSPFSDSGYKGDISYPCHISRSCSKDCIDLISRLLEKEPKKRIGYVHDSLEIIAHDWFRDVDIGYSTQVKQINKADHDFQMIGGGVALLHNHEYKTDSECDSDLSDYM